MDCWRGDPYLPQSLQRPTVDLDPIDQQIKMLAATVSDQSTQIIALVDRDYTPQIDALAARIAKIENAPRPTKAADGADVAILRSELADQRQVIEALQAVAQNIATKNEGAAANMLAKSAVLRVLAAVEGGGSFAPALADLAATGAAIPNQLRAAQNGVPTLAALQNTFPDAARAALNAVRGQEGGTGITAFLKRQLGARSVAPREGADTDAVLSRAENALRNGQIDTALSELDGLPEAAKMALGDWLPRAELRQKTQAAAQELAASIAAN